MGHRRTAEHATGHSHNQRRRHTLACHIAYTEVEFLVADKEVEEVAAHLLGRNHLAKDIDIGALWERRIDLRQHALLDVAGNLQLLLQSCIRGCGLPKFLDILRKRALHVAKGIAQCIYLAGLNLGQLNIETSFGHLFGCGHEAVQRQHILLDKMMAK